MNRIRMWLLWSAAALVTLLVSSTITHAQSRKVLVLIDASGSMNITRPQDPTNATRFAAAKARATLQLREAINTRAEVAVYTFSGSGATPQTQGFVSRSTAIATIDGLDLFTVGGGSTPLAGSVCDAVDTLVAAAPNRDDTRILQLASDGEENSTPPGDRCQGPTSATTDAPYTPGSWQNRVLNYVVEHGVTPNIDLFDPRPIVGFAAPRRPSSDPDELASAAVRARAAGLTADGPPSLADFFTELAREAGGRLTVIADQQAQLPVYADFNGNSCTDRSDALLIARGFGRTGAPQDNPLDLDADGAVGFSDYALALASFTAGGCGAAEPYVARVPIVCTSSQPVTIDGQVIEAGGITIDARGPCRITIRNSLIVSGQNAINVQGTAILTVDNSILVGENAVLAAQGSTALSAASSVFHGARTTRGAFVFVDRGGNTFE